MSNNYFTKRYNWQHPDWPQFTYDLSGVHDIIYRYGIEAGSLSGGLEQLPEEVQSETLIDVMVREGLKSSEIEGEKIDYDDIRSSIQKELGIAHQTVKDAKAMGIARLMMSLKNTFNDPLSEELLCNWHGMLLSAESQRIGIEVGSYRTDPEPMQIISGAMGHERVHFEAPPSEHVAHEMKQFVNWFNATRAHMPGVVRAAVAHIYFESIHPFGDGNGRIGRALSEKALSQELNKPVLISLSTIIQSEQKQYYAELSRASSYDLDITSWVSYFVNTVYRAQLDAKQKNAFVLQKTKFWKRYEHRLNERQQKVIARMFEAGEGGYIGGMNAAKFISIAKCSKATATRDLAELVDWGAFVKLPGGGRSTRYNVVL